MTLHPLLLRKVRTNKLKEVQQTMDQVQVSKVEGSSVPPISKTFERKKKASKYSPVDKMTPLPSFLWYSMTLIFAIILLVLLFYDDTLAIVFFFEILCIGCHFFFIACNFF
ncbi:hypothetical protein U1Q18_032995 [Sarracenia purpurea var. burkii]